MRNDDKYFISNYNIYVDLSAENGFSYVFNTSSRMKENVTKEELLEYISEVDKNHAMNSEIDLLYKIREDGIFVPKCFECSSCLFKANCCYKLYEKINTSISFADETLDEKFNKFIELIS